MVARTFYEAIGQEKIDWEPYFLPVSQRPTWMEGGGIEGLGNWQKPRRPRPHNRTAIQRAHEENREFPADSELETSGLKDNEYLQSMRLWIQLHYMTDNDRVPRQVPGSPPPHGPERIGSEVAPAGSRNTQGRALPRGVQIVRDPVSGTKRVTTKTSIQIIYPSQQSRGIAHATQGEIGGEIQSPKMYQRAPVTTPDVHGKGRSPQSGLRSQEPLRSGSEDSILRRYSGRL